MTARQTMTVKQLPRHRQQVRSFALIWTGITLLVGACTFISIYAATGIAARSSNNPGNRGLAPLGAVVATDDNVQTVALQNAPTLVPAAPATNTPLGADGQAVPTLVGAGGAQAVQPAPATAIPTVAQVAIAVNPINDLDFDMGIAVQDNVDANTYKVWVDMTRNQLRLNWVKSQVVWRDVEKTRGQIDFAAMDVAIPMMHEAGVKIMLSIAKAPDWARDPGAPTNQPGHLDGPPANPLDFATFLTTLLRRYPGMINAIEVWNEVNLDREWATAPQTLNPARYVSLLKTAHDAIKGIDPNIIVITAALAPTGANNGVNFVDDFVYMDKLIAAGMLNYADCVGAHANGLNVPPTADWNNIPERTPRANYRGPWDNPNHSWAFKSTIQGYADKIQKAGSNLKLCMTEFGWPTSEGLTGKVPSGFEFANDNTAQDQADFTDQAITEMQQWGYIRLAFLFNLNYGPQIGWQLEVPGGDNVLWCVIGKDWANRPVWQKIVDRNFKEKPRKAS